MNYMYKTFTLCLKKCTNFETALIKIIRIDFDDISQKYFILEYNLHSTNSTVLHIREKNTGREG